MRTPNPHTIVPASYPTSDLRNDLLFLPDFVRQSPHRKRFYKASHDEMERFIASGRVATVDAKRRIWQFVGDLVITDGCRRVHGSVNGDERGVGRIGGNLSRDLRQVVESEMGRRPIREATVNAGI